MYYTIFKYNWLEKLPKTELVRYSVFRLTGCTRLFPNRFPALRISSEMGFGLKGMVLVFRARYIRNMYIFGEVSSSLLGIGHISISGYTESKRQ